MSFRKGSDLPEHIKVQLESPVLLLVQFIISLYQSYVPRKIRKAKNRVVNFEYSKTLISLHLRHQL